MRDFSVNVRSNADSVIADFLFAAEEMPDATVRALNKIADQGKTFGAREIKSAGYNLKIGDIKRAMRVRRASKGNLKATIITTGRPIPLIAYGARQTAKGVTVNVLSGRKLIPGAFIATMPSGHKGVYVRAPGAKHKKVGQGSKASWHALPIRELYGPSIPDAMNNKGVQAALLALTREKFPAVLAHEQAWLKRRGRR